MMRRTILLLSTMTIAVLLASGLALAAARTCMLLRTLHGAR